MKSVRYFIWVVVPIAVFLALQIFGAPFIRWNFSWRDDGQGYDPVASRYFLSCTYLNFGGSFSVRPRDGNCPLVRFETNNSLGEL